MFDKYVRGVMGKENSSKESDWFIVSSFLLEVWTVLFEVIGCWFVNDEIYGDDLMVLLKIQRNPDNKTSRSKEIHSSSVKMYS